MGVPLERIYASHHAARRGEDFVVLGDMRGPFLKKAVGIGKRVLDIGCRDGALTRFFAEGNTVTGADIDSGALRRAEAKLGIETKQVDLNGEWGFPPRSFDAVVAAEVIEHLYYPETVLAKIAAVLVPDGMLAGTVPNAFSLKNRARYLVKRKAGTPLSDPTHINHFTVAELDAALKKRFTSVTIEGFGRYRRLSKWFPQTIAFDLAFVARGPREP